MHSYLRVFVVTIGLMAGSGVWAAKALPASCLPAMYTDESAEGKCATNAGYDQCRVERDACFAANPLKKKPCVVAARACGANVVALKKEAAQCRWRSRMKKVFTNNDHTDAVKLPCKVQLANLRKAEQADTAKENIQFMTETNASAVAK